MVSISNAFDAGTLGAVAGDVYSLSKLFSATAPSGSSIAGYRVALGAGDGKLLLNGTDVSSRTSFTAAEFSELTYTAGASGGQQNLVVVAQTGTKGAGGTLYGITDSPAVQITADVTGSRSINALAALVTTPTGADANVANVVQEAGIFTGLGITPTRPSVATQGNFTAVAGDTYQLSKLFSASAPSGSSIAGYRVALGAGDGTLLLNGTATTRTSFTAAEFGELTYTAGASGQQNLVVVAQTGTKGAGGTLYGITDSPAVQITADVTGSRSINALAALVTTPTGADANVANVVQEAGIFTGLGITPTRPSVATQGNFTAVAGDTYQLSKLFSASAPSGSSIAGYRVALGAGDGTLLLNGTATTRTSFTAAEFGELTYTAGASGGQQNLVVVAQTGTKGAGGTLYGITDSPAVQITADVTGSRSINALAALVTTPTGADANVANVVQEAGIFTGLGITPTRPTVSTQGNFTAVAGDTYQLSKLFSATAPSGSSIAGYRVALGAGDGTLLLNGTATTRTSFTAAEFGELTYTAGASGQQNLVVVAQTGTKGAGGTLYGITDSPAVQITADVTGSRSINALAALVTTPTGADANVANVVQEAGIFTGLGITPTRPSVATQGNFTAVAGDTYQLSKLFSASAPSGSSIAGYRVALGAGDGTLLLNGTATTRTSFTAAEFGELTYTAGASGGQQNLVVVAQTGTKGAGGTLYGITDSPAVQITADVTGSRSINALAALVTTPTGADANVANVVQEAGIFTGLGITPTRPSVETALTPDPSVPLANLPAATGAYAEAGTVQGGSAVDLASYYPDAIGGSVTPGVFSNPDSAAATALDLLDNTATGAWQEAGGTTPPSAAAIKAYSSSQAL